MFDIKTKTSDFASIVVTHDCNKNCIFCVDKYRGRKEYIDLNTVHSSLYLLRNNTNVKEILLVGGEPTLHPDIVKIAKLVKSFDFKLILTTNYSKPEIIKLLDGIVDCFNISYYGKKDLPKQKDFKSDITLNTIIHKQQLETKEKLDNFINKYQTDLNLKFSTLAITNSWTKEYQKVSYLDCLNSENVVLFNEILGQLYRGTVIKRQDKVLNQKAEQSIKCHVNGEISYSWEREERYSYEKRDIYLTELKGVYQNG